MPIVKSNWSTANQKQLGKHQIPTENANDMLFTFCFETNPAQLENVEFRVHTRVASVEVFYEKTFITELLRFFRTDLIDFEEVKRLLIHFKITY